MQVPTNAGALSNTPPALKQGIPSTLKQGSPDPAKQGLPTSVKPDIQAGNVAQVAQNASKPGKAADLPETKGAEQTGYLKVLSRLENMLKKDELPEKAIENFVKAVSRRLNEASDGDKKVMLQSQEAKALGIQKNDEVADKIKSGLEDKKSTAKVFALLKQNKFVEMMNGNEQQANSTYGPNGKAAAETKPEVKNDPPPAATPPPKPEIAAQKQAIAALKAMQAQGGASAAEMAPKQKIAV